jgi:hypothetical protein
VASEIDEAGTAPAGPAPETTQDGRPRGWLDRLHLWALVELFVLSGFAIAQPLLDVTGKSPDFFLFRRADRLDIVALVLGVLVLPAFFIWGFEVAVGLVSERVRRWLHLAAVAGLFALLAIQVAKKLTDLRGPVVVAAALAAGVGAAALYARTSWLRLWLRYLAPAPLAFALVFLLISPVSKLVLPARAEATASAAPAVVAGAKHPPVVVIFFDEFPLKSLLNSKGQIDRRVYPNFARLADQSTWYRNATGVSGFTPWAMPAMLTGRYPEKVKAPSYTEYPDNMLTLFGRYYDLKAYETISQLCPPSKCRSTAGNLDRVGLSALVGDSAKVFSEIVSPYDTAVDPATFIDQTAAEESAPKDGKPLDPQFRFNQLRLNQPSRFNDFLAGLKASDQPTLHFLHILLPHAPWRYLPTGNEYNYKTFGRAFKSDQTPAPIVELAHERHLLQLAYTDRLVGQVIDKLKAEHLWDKSLVAMGADHGEGWVPGEKPRSLGKTNASDLMWVPQFIKAPGQDNGVPRRPQLGAGLPAPDHRRPDRHQGPLEDGRGLPDRQANPDPDREVVVRHPRPPRDPARAAQLGPGPQGHHRHPGPGQRRRQGAVPLRRLRRPRLPRPGLGGRDHPQPGGHRHPRRLQAVQPDQTHLGPGPGVGLGHPHLAPASGREHRAGGRQRQDRRRVQAVPAAAGRSGGQLRRHHP